MKYADGERRYIIAPNKIKVGDSVLSAEQTEMKSGNCMKLANIPLGTTIHCVEMKPGKERRLQEVLAHLQDLLQKKESTQL